MGGAEVAVGAEQLALGLLGPMAGEEIGVGAGEGEAPGGARMAAGDLHHHLEEDAGLELQTAEHPGRHDPIEARVHELLLDVVRDPAQPVALGLAGVEFRPHRPRPIHQLFPQVRRLRRPHRTRAFRHAKSSQTDVPCAGICRQIAGLSGGVQSASVRAGADGSG